MLVHNGCKDKNAWNQFQQDHAGETNPQTGKKYTRTELAAKYQATNQSKQVQNSSRVNANSLDTDKPAIGYSLRDRDTGEILKYGETTRGKLRYTEKYLTEHNAVFFPEAHGTKREMHYWQHEKILDYMYVADQRPPLNKSTW